MITDVHSSFHSLRPARRKLKGDLEWRDDCWMNEWVVVQSSKKWKKSKVIVTGGGRGEFDPVLKKDTG